MTKRSLVKQYSTYNMYKSCGQIIIQTTRYPVNQRYIIGEEWVMRMREKARDNLKV